MYVLTFKRQQLLFVRCAFLCRRLSPLNIAHIGVKKGTSDIWEVQFYHRSATFYDYCRLLFTQRLTDAFEQTFPPPYPSTHVKFSQKQTSCVQLEIYLSCSRLLI